MSSQRKLEANRRNGRLSQGPKTSRNAISEYETGLQMQFYRAVRTLTRPLLHFEYLDTALLR